MIGPFGGGSKSGSEATSRVKRLFREVFGVGEEASLMVTELQCSEPGCPPIETVIAILDEGGNRQFKVHKSASEVSEADVRSLVKERKFEG